jgi:hypothetical protein
LNMTGCIEVGKLLTYVPLSFFILGILSPLYSALE